MNETPNTLQGVIEGIRDSRLAPGDAVDIREGRLLWVRPDQAVDQREVVAVEVASGHSGQALRLVTRSGQDVLVDLDVADAIPVFQAVARAVLNLDRVVVPDAPVPVTGAPGGEEAADGWCPVPGDSLIPDVPVLDTAGCDQASTVPEAAGGSDLSDVPDPVGDAGAEPTGAPEVASEPVEDPFAFLRTPDVPADSAEVKVPEVSADSAEPEASSDHDTGSSVPFDPNRQTLQEWLSGLPDPNRERTNVAHGVRLERQPLLPFD